MAHCFCFRRSPGISAENQRPSQQERDGASPERHFAAAQPPVRRHKAHCCLLAWMSAPSGVKHHGLRLKTRQSHGAVPCLPETTAAHAEPALPTETPDHLLIKTITRSIARPFWDTGTISMFCCSTWIFGEWTNRNCDPTQNLPDAQTNGRTTRPLPDSRARMQRCPSLRPTWDCYSLGKPETKFSTYLESILLPSLYRSQASPLMKKVLCTLALPFLYFDLRYRWLCLIVSLLQSNLLKRSKQNTRSQIHRWYNSIDFSSITPGIDPAVTVSIKVSGKEVYLLP